MKILITNKSICDTFNFIQGKEYNADKFVCNIKSPSRHTIYFAPNEDGREIPLQQGDIEYVN